VAGAFSFFLYLLFIFYFIYLFAFYAFLLFFASFIFPGELSFVCPSPFVVLLFPVSYVLGAKKDRNFWEFSLQCYVLVFVASYVLCWFRCALGGVSTFVQVSAMLRTLVQFPVLIPNF
jgi:hypothetical protein